MRSRSWDGAWRMDSSTGWWQTRQWRIPQTHTHTHAHTRRHMRACKRLLLDFRLGSHSNTLFLCMLVVVSVCVPMSSWNTDWGQDGYFKIAKGVNEGQIEEMVRLAQTRRGPFAAAPAQPSPERAIHRLLTHRLLLLFFLLCALLLCFALTDVGWTSQAALRSRRRRIGGTRRHLDVGMSRPIFIFLSLFFFS